MNTINYFPSNNDKIIIDNVGKYSISLPDKAKIITNLILKHFGSINNNQEITITDAMACVGGDTLSFSQTFKLVNAIEMDKDRFNYLKHNMDIFNCKNITYYNDNYLKIYKTLKQDIIYLDPPWGGPEYKNKKTIKIKLGDTKLEELCFDIIDNKLCKLLVLKLPFNYDLNELKFYNLNMYVLNKILLIIIKIE
jgi:16S rRNA G966 N2-methylase RsmD